MFKSFCAIFCLINHSYGGSMEQTCYSRFDYDEKMLLKLLKIEDQIKKFEDNLTEMKKTLTDEKSYRMELFENKMDEFKERNIEEIQKQHNLTESIRASQERMNSTMGELIQQLKIEAGDQIKKFEDYLTEMKETLNAEKSDRMESFENKMDEFKKRNIEEIQRQQNLTESIRASQERMNTTMGELIKHQHSLIKEALNEVNETVETYKKFTEDKDVVFTITSPDEGHTSGSLTFYNVITNEGDGYNISTGIFTCPIRGLYYFSLHLVKRYGSNLRQVGCYIKRDGTDIVRAHFNPEDYESDIDYGSYGVSTSVYIKLEKDDLVTVAGCYSNKAGWASWSLESWSSFSGHLIKSYF